MPAGRSAPWLLSRPRLQSSSPHRTAATKKNGEEEARDKKNRVGRGDREERWRAYFYARERKICQLLGDEKL